MKNPSMNHVKGTTWSELAALGSKVSQITFSSKYPLFSYTHLPKLHFFLA